MKNIKSIELLPDENQPFKDCKLDREKYADVLTEIVSTYSDGFVLAIDNEWGTGKTTFVKMWRRKLELQEFQTAYFNAWENDFDSNPMVAIMSELKTLIKDETKFDKIVKIGSKITKNVLPTVAKTVASLFASTKAISEIIEKIVEASADILTEEISEHQKKKESLVEFRTVLAESIQVEGIKKPIVFFIDELDRCRPDYAVETLEKVKHFFNVPGIVFVLSIDKKQLSHSINGYYGSENFNSNEYLRRFIDLEYFIPEPNIEQYINYLFIYYDFGIFFGNPDRKHPELTNDGTKFKEFAIELFSKKELNLRQVEKIMINCKLALRLFKSNSYLIPQVFLMLIYFKSNENEFYKAINKKVISIQDLVKKLDEFFLSFNKYGNIKPLIQIESRFLNMYHNSMGNKINSTLYNYDESNILKLHFHSVLDKSNNNEDFKMIMNQVLNENSSELILDHLLSKINLLESLSRH